MREKLKIALASAVQTSFWGSSKMQYHNYYVPEMQKIAKDLRFELMVIDQEITNGLEAEKVRREIENQDIDFLLIQLSTFAAGDIISPLVDTGIRIGLWGIPEFTDNGAIPLNSFCGMNMYASIIRQYIDRNLKYKWFYGDVQDPLFIDRFRLTVKALASIKNLNNAKIGLVGGIAPGFNDLYYDERKTKQKLGVQVDSFIEYSDIKEQALKYEKEEVQSIIDEIKNEGCISQHVSVKALENTARVYKAFENLILKNDYDAIAISCWPKFRRDLGIVVCFVISRLLDKGYIAACEGDVDSAISMLLLHYLTGEMPMLMDLSKMDMTDESILMWHCGSAPKRYSDKEGMCIAGHYKPGSRVTGVDDINVGTVADMYFKPQDATIARLTNDYEDMFVMSGCFIDKQDRSFDGSRGWIGGLTMDGEKVSLKDLANTILVNGFQHHYPIVAGSVEKEVMEVMYWLDIMRLPIVEYRDYMQDIGC